jgi:hypothetical protein
MSRPARPDYAAIARIEREIYGETFTHDGAPLPAVCVNGCAKPLYKGGMCCPCYRRCRN